MAYEEVTSIEIHGVNDIINFVKSNSLKKYHANTNYMTWYRGQGNYNWKLEPAVYRDGKFQNESVYIKELERRRPADFAFDNNFDKLVKMQHYGLPTRLLDITTNPLVALYFACQNERDADGAFYYFSTPTFWEDNWAVKIVVDFVFEPETCIESLVRREKKRMPFLCDLSDKDAESSIWHSLFVPAHAILPRMTNQRIIQQSGGFLLFGMSLEKVEVSDNIGNYGKRFMSLLPLNENQQKMICPVIKKLKIPKEYKTNIIKELDLLNINEGFLFPELEYQVKSVITSIEST